MRAVMLSVRPQWCEKIAARWKSLELRKNKPNIPLPFKCYLYQTSASWGYPILRSLGPIDLLNRLAFGKGKVIGEFVCDHILGHCEMANADLAEQQSYVRRADIFKYSGGKEVFGWHISNLVIYEEPKPVSAFCVSGTCDERNCEICLWTNGEFYADDTHCKVGEGKKPLFRPPQSWCYVEEMKGGESDA